MKRPITGDRISEAATQPMSTIASDIIQTPNDHAISGLVDDREGSLPGC